MTRMRSSKASWRNGMALIEFEAREKAVKVAKTKAIRVDESLQESVGLYREFLVSEQGADPKKFRMSGSSLPYWRRP